MGRRKRIAAVLPAGGVLVAPGSDDEPEVTAPTEPATAETTTTVATSTTAPPTTTTMPASGPMLVQSTVYPYGLTVLAQEIARPFQPASIAWNGETRVIRGSPSLDVHALSDGLVHILEIEWPDDVQSLAQMFADHGERHNSCSQAKNQQEITIAGNPLRCSRWTPSVPTVRTAPSFALPPARWVRPHPVHRDGNRPGERRHRATRDAPVRPGVANGLSAGMPVADSLSMSEPTIRSGRG